MAGTRIILVQVLRTGTTLVRAHMCGIRQGESTTASWQTYYCFVANFVANLLLLCGKLTATLWQTFLANLLLLCGKFSHFVANLLSLCGKLSTLDTAH